MWIMFITISIISGTISSMGIGGGSIFILLTTIFNIFEQRQAQGYNLIMFIAVGISSTLFNLKNKNIDLKFLFKLLFPLLIGSIIGNLLQKKINPSVLNYAFYIFVIIIGLYEIISSVKQIINAKNKNKRKE